MRLGGEEGDDERAGHDGGGDAVGAGPAETVGEDQGAAAREQHGDAIAGDVEGGAGGAARGRERVGAVGVDDDVVGGGGEDEQEGDGGDDLRPARVG